MSMKSTPLDYVLAYTQLILVLAAVYQEPLGLPEESDTVLFVAAGVCLVIFVLRRRRRTRSQKAGANASVPQNWFQRTWADKSKRFWLALAVVDALALIGLFIAQYTGSTLSFSQQVLTSVISFALFTAVAWFITR
jgi:hypothetical protein